MNIDFIILAAGKGTRMGGEEPGKRMTLRGGESKGGEDTERGKER